MVVSVSSVGGVSERRSEACRNSSEWVWLVVGMGVGMGVEFEEGIGRDLVWRESERVRMKDMRVYFEIEGIFVLNWYKSLLLDIF